MSSLKDVLGIIRAYLERHHDGQVTYSQLLSFADRYILENPALDKTMDDMRRNLHRTLSANLEQLEESGDLRIVKRDNVPINIIYPAYFIEKIASVYERLEEKPEIPFPNEDNLGITIPMDLVTPVDIKADFMTWLSRVESDDVKILKINFPDGILSLIATSDILRTKVLQNSVHRIRHYLRDPKNLSYTRQKLTPLLKSRELAIKDMLHSIVTTPETSTQTIFEPSDFTFHLWTQLSTNIIKEYGPKADKLAEEHGFCQAAYLMGYYNVHFRGKQQRRKEEDIAFNIFLQLMRRSPYAYKLSEIYEFKDDKGIYLIKRIDKERIGNHLHEHLAPIGKQAVPDFLKIKTTKGDDFFLLYTSVVPLLTEGIIRAQKEMREFYQRSWLLSLKQDIEFTTMHSEQEFRDHIEARLGNHYPLLYSLMSYQAIFFASRIEGISEKQRTELMDMLNIEAQKIKPWDAIFRLNRRKLLDDIKMLLPAWMVIPIVKSIVRFWRSLFLGKDLANKPYAEIFDHEGQVKVESTKKKKPAETTEQSRTVAKVAGGSKQTDSASSAESTNAAASARQQALRFREAAKQLEEEFLPQGSKIQATLQTLVDRWNPLLDPQAKKNLTEDVNSLARDFLRKMKITSKGKLPTGEDVRSYAQKLWQMDNLLAIRNRKDLLRYLELYILYLLENMP